MNRGVRDGRGSDASSLHMDLTNLVTWAHSHGAICSQTLTLETARNTGRPLLWMCGAGHAYYWHCEELEVRSREENKGVRKRSESAEPSSRKANLDEKRFRMTRFYERAEADTADTGSWSRCPGITQKDDIVHVIQNEPPARGDKREGKSPRSCIAAERRLSRSGGEANTSRCQVMLESNKALKILSDEEGCILDEGDQENRVNQTILSKPPEGAAAAVDLQRHRNQRVAFNTPTATQTSAFAPTGKPPLTPAFIPKSSASNQESLDSSFLRLSPHLAGTKTETFISRNSSRSETPQEHLQSFHVSNPEAKAQPESPTSVTFFGFQATIDIQEQLQLSPSECSFSGNAAEHPTEEAEPSGSGHATHLSSSMSSVSSNDECLPESSSESMLKHEQKRNPSHGNIKVFKDWLLLHHPSETREIHKLPPQDLNNYLASFYSSVKSQKGMDFSKASLHFFQLNIERYLKDHGYKYSVVKGLEFRAAQEALQLRQQQLSQRKREEDMWNMVERLTEEDVDSLRRKELLSKENPQGLLTLMLINIIRGFGAHTHSRSFTLYWGQLVLRQDERELEFLEWKDEPGEEASTGEPAPQLLAKPDNPENCPVMDYKEYAKRRPPDMCNYYDPLYLAPKPLCSLWDQVWFCRKPLAKGSLKKIFSIIAQQVKRPVKKHKK